MKTENLPEMIFLSKVGEHLTEAILITLLTAVLNGLNVSDNVDHVLLQDVALARTGHDRTGPGQDRTGHDRK